VASEVGCASDMGVGVGCASVVGGRVWYRVCEWYSGTGVGCASGRVCG